MFRIEVRSLCCRIIRTLPPNAHGGGERRRAFTTRKVLLPCIFHLSTLCCLVFITWAYVSSESGVYWWDYANYQNITHTVVAEFHRSPWAALQFIQRSLANNYNAVFTIPLLPFVLLLGDSRLTFEIGLVVVYLFPFALTMGGIAARIIPAHSRLVYWLTVGVTLLTPSSWAPVLRGYPDIGAATCVALAVFFNLGDQSKKRVPLIALAGVMLAIAALLRRHFVYSIVSFFLSWSLLSVLYFAAHLLHHVRGTTAEFFQNALRIGLTGCVMLLTLFLVGRPFLRLVTTTNFTALYASYMQPWHVVLARFATSFGWILFGLAIAGCAIGISSFRTWAAQFVYLFAVVSALVWIFAGRQLGNHYSLHFIPLVVQGLVVLGYMAHRNLRDPALRRLATIFGGALLFVNFLSGLTTIDPFRTFNWRCLFAQNWPPIQRNDVNQLVQLVTNLRALTGKQDIVYVVASSHILNSDLIANVERVVYGWEQSRLNLISYDVDSKHPYPLEALLQAQIVVLAEPVQLHLRPEQQGLVRSVFDLFNSKLYLAQDFTLLPERYALDGGVIVYLYKRTRPTQLEVAIQTLRFIQEYVAQSSISQPNWIVLSPTAGITVHPYSPCQHLISLSMGMIDSPFPPTVLFLRPSMQLLTIRGKVNFLSRDCSDIMLTFLGWDREGKAQHICAQQFRASDIDNKLSEFYCAVPVPPDTLTLIVEEENSGQVMGICPLEILVEITYQTEERP